MKNRVLSIFVNVIAWTVVAVVSFFKKDITLIALGIAGCLIIVMNFCELLSIFKKPNKVKEHKENEN